MNEYQVCPFLISRNYDTDYKVIVAPDFIFQQELFNVLLEATGDEDLTPEGWAVYRQVLPEEIQDFTIVFRVKYAIGKDVNLETNEILADFTGRAINVIEGIIILGQISINNLIITSNNFARLHNSMMNYYSNFWKGEIEPQKTSNFFINKDNSKTLNLKELEPFRKYKKNIESPEPEVTNPGFKFKKIITIFILIGICGFITSIFLKEKNEPNIKYYLETKNPTILTRQNPQEEDNSNNPIKDRCDNYELREHQKLLVEDFIELNKNFYIVLLAESIGNSSCQKYRLWYILKNHVQIKQNQIEK